MTIVRSGGEEETRIAMIMDDSDFPVFVADVCM